MATNRHDTLDPALLRPGRLDRKIEFPLPSRRERRLVFQTVTSKMNLGPDVDLEDCERHRSCLGTLLDLPPLCSDVSRPDRLSSAEISSVVQAAGLQGIPPNLSSHSQQLIEIYSRSQKSLCHPSHRLRGSVESECLCFELLSALLIFPLTTSKRSRETTRHTNSVRKTINSALYAH